MSGLNVNVEVINQRGTPALYADALANRPAAGFVGRIFIDTDSPSSGIYRDTGTAWVNVAGGGGGTQNLQSVCTFGNTTTTRVGIGVTPPGATSQLLVNSSDTFTTFPNCISQTFGAVKDQTFTGASIISNGPAYVAGAFSTNTNCAANVNIPNGVSQFGSLYCSDNFITNGQTITQNQAGGIRAISEVKTFKSFSGGATGGSMSHAAGLWSGGVYSTGANPTITNNYGVLISNQTEVFFGTITNRYGIYQEGQLDNNVFFGKVAIAGTGGPVFGVEQSNFGGAAQIGPYVSITGAGTTSATYGLRVLNSGSLTGLIVLDNGNVGIRVSAPTARMHIATGGATTASLGLKVRNSADTVDILSTFGTTQVIINSNSGSLQTSAQLQIDSTTRGVLIPRMTTAEILAIGGGTPAEGLLVYNTTISHLCCYQAGAWVKFSHSPM
jgi:hypothetical protein